MSDNVIANRNDAPDNALIAFLSRDILGMPAAVLLGLIVAMALGGTAAFLRIGQ